MEKISVIICDSQFLTSIGIKTVLGQYFKDGIVFNEALTKEEVIDRLNKKEDHILIIDYDLMDFEDTSDLESIINRYPSVGILVVTSNQNPDTILKVLDAGVKNYLLKTCNDNELIEAFRCTLEGKKYFSGKVLDVLLNKNSSSRYRKEPGKLTVAEIEIVRLITQGLTTKEIAIQKSLSFHTIITHRKNIFRKLGITNTSELHMYALRYGLIDTTEYYI